MEYNGYKITWRIVLLECVCLFASSFFQIYLTDEADLSFYSSMLISQLHMLIPIAVGGFYILKNHSYYSFSSAVGLREFDPIILLPTLLLPISSESFATWMMSPYLQNLTDIFGGQTDYMSAPQSVRELLVVVLLLCVVVPIMEEILFRGILFKILEPYGTLYAIFISAFAFSLMHFSPPVLIIIFVVGAALGFLRVCADSLIPCMIFHALFNFSSVMQLVFESELSAFELQLGIISVIAAALLPILLFIVYKIWGKGKFYKGIVKPKKKITISIAAVVVIYAISALGSVAMNNFNISGDAVEDFFEEVYDFDF